jgi:acetyl esterase/lipase
MPFSVTVVPGTTAFAADTNADAMRAPSLLVFACTPTESRAPLDSQAFSSHAHACGEDSAPLSDDGTARNRRPRIIRYDHGAVISPEGVTYRSDTVGGISGWLCQPADARPGKTTLHLHGGWFNWGSAEAFRHLVGHIARHAGIKAFVPDYRLAPEHPFPAAVHDVQACYRGLIENGRHRIALARDSAGGNLALVLLSTTMAQAPADAGAPAGAVVLSPVTDLALTGASWETPAARDPHFVHPEVMDLIRPYLRDSDPTDPLAPPLCQAVNLASISSICACSCS